MNKTNTSKRPAHSGFEVEPLAGTVTTYPKGTKFKKNADGTRTPIYPKAKPAKKK